MITSDDRLFDLDINAVALLGVHEAIAREDLARLSLLICKLDTREQIVLRAYYGIGREPMPSWRISARLQIGPSRVHEIRQRALKNLRAMFFEPERVALADSEAREACDRARRALGL